VALSRTGKKILFLMYAAVFQSTVELAGFRTHFSFADRKYFFREVDRSVTEKAQE
jgi:hypothetical protein